MIEIPSATLIAIVSFGGLFGLAIGSFLNVIVVRVPAGTSLTRASRCPACGDAIKPWQNVPVVSWMVLRGRCASCGSAISRRYPLVELITGIAFAGVTWFFLVFPPAALAPFPVGAWQLALAIVAYLYFAAIAIALTLIDIDTHRLPNAIVLPSYVVGVVLLGASSLCGGDSPALLRAALGAAALFAFYYLLRLIRPAGMGGGDVKLAGVIGLHLAWLGWSELLVGAFAAFVLGGVFGIALILAGRAGRKTAVPFGPWMLAGAWAGIFLGEPLARWYTGLFTAL